MSLESAEYINELVLTNPEDTDQAHEADDHMRLIKKVLQQSFPNISEAVTATALDLNVLTGSSGTGAVIVFSPGDRIMLMSSRLPAGWTVYSATADRVLLGTETLSEADDWGGTWDHGTGLYAQPNTVNVQPNPATGGPEVNTDSHGHNVLSDQTWRPAYVKVITIQKL